MKKTAPNVVPEADWKEVKLPFSIASGRTLAGTSGNDNLRVRFFLRTTDNHLIGKIWFGEGAEGPPLHAHGGASAYILDEAMGAVGWANKFPVVAAELKFELFNMVPLFQDHTIEAWIEQVIGRRVMIKAQLTLADGRVAVRGQSQFHILAQSQMHALFSQLPESRKEAEQDLLTEKYQWAEDDNAD